MMRKRRFLTGFAVCSGAFLFAASRLADNVFIFGVLRDLNGWFFPAFVTLALIALSIGAGRALRLALIFAVLSAFPFFSPVMSFTGEPQETFSAPVAEEGQGEDARSETVRLYLHNTLYNNERYEEAAELAASAAFESDIMFLQEVRPELFEKLDMLAGGRFPYRFFNSDDSHPSVFFSRYPVEEHAFIPHVVGGKTYIDALLRLSNGEKLRFVGVHLISPVHARRKSHRDTQLVHLTETLFSENNGDVPTIVAGDFNATLYTPDFARLVKRTPLKTGRGLRDIQGTWPAFLPEPFRISIDHALAGNRVRVTGREVGAAAGSDHLAVRYVFEVRGR